MARHQGDAGPRVRTGVSDGAPPAQAQTSLAARSILSERTIPGYCAAVSALELSVPARWHRCWNELAGIENGSAYFIGNVVRNGLRNAAVPAQSVRALSSSGLRTRVATELSLPALSADMAEAVFI